MSKKVAVAEIQIAVLGTQSTSMSTFVAIAAKALKEKGMKHQITPMGTAIEGSLDEILESVKAVHESLRENGAKRIVTHLSIDDRCDNPKGLEGKVASVREKLAKTNK